MIVLRDIKIDDLHCLVQWRNDPDVNRYLSNRLKTINEARSWFDKLSAIDGIWMKAIEKSGKLIGYATVESIDRTNRKCELAMVIGEKDYWGKGAGTVALKEMLLYAFKTLRMHRVWAAVARGNDRSRRLVESAGLTFEGIMRETIIINGEFTDLFCYSILEHEYKVR